MRRPVHSTYRYRSVGATPELRSARRRRAIRRRTNYVLFCDERYCRVICQTFTNQYHFRPTDRHRRGGGDGFRTVFTLHRTHHAIDVNGRRAFYTTSRKTSVPLTRVPRDSVETTVKLTPVTVHRGPYVVECARLIKPRFFSFFFYYSPRACYYYCYYFIFAGPDGESYVVRACT